MRVKLSYTVEEEDVLQEAGKIIGLASNHMQHSIFLYTAIQTLLVNDRDDGDDEPVDIPASLEMIEEFRQALLNVDTRLAEVVDIIEGYDSYEKDSDESPPSKKR
tara:strand:+ start:1359 stop:1673 length:315 start_codon:yes stop_codon:yes gene_type:complete